MSLKKVLLFGAALLGTLVVLDIYLQVAEIQTPMETRIDSELGPTYIPNKRITRFNEGFFIGGVNEFGYMGPAVPPRREEGEGRVLLIGDSYVLGHTVLPRHYFGRFLEQTLTKELGEKVLALNFGKADFNFGNMYQYYMDFAGRFDHDLALFFVGEGDLVPLGQVVSSLYPTIELLDETIVIDKNFSAGKTYRFYHVIEPLFTRSAVLRLAFNTYKVINSGSWIVVVLDKLAALGASEVAGASAEATQVSLELPRLSRAILSELAKDTRNVLVVRTVLAPELIKEIKTIGMPLIDLGGYLEALRNEGKDPDYWPVTGMRGHWNHAAHPLIANFLNEQILSRRLLSPPFGLLN